MKNLLNYTFAPLQRSEFDFFVRSAGHYKLSSPDKGSWKKADFCELFWCVRGAGAFILKNRQYTLKPGYLWYYPPGSQHYFFPAGSFFEYRWLALDGVSAPMLFQGFRIRTGMQYAGECPDSLFQRLELETASMERKHRLAALSLAFSILAAAASGQKKQRNRKSCCAEDAKQIIEEEYANPELNVERLSQLLHVNRVSLSRAFSRTYGMPVSGYLSACRVRAALELLKSPGFSIGEISAMCGFSSPAYFSKVISAMTGFPPCRLR